MASTSILERALGSNKLYTEKYIRDNILLTKSIVIKSKREAELYNDYVTIAKGLAVDLTDPASWRYYHHLAAQYHAADVPMTITSKDNGAVITLNQASIAEHVATRSELLQFGFYYKELVDRYPDQELLIRSLIATSERHSIQSALEADNWAIICYNVDLIEENESNLLYSLQSRIDNYKVIRLITYYAETDSLFMASLFQVLYHFILTSLIAIRLTNAKTQLAHSYHVLSYLASHHGLDRHYLYMTKSQRLFLYRNLLYLDNHSGRQHVFKLLIDKIFTDKRVSVVNYRSLQRNQTNSDSYIDYRFKQVLLNTTPLPYENRDFSLDELAERERPLAPGNAKEYQHYKHAIDLKNRNGLFADIATKDLEINLVDNTNDVRRKLIPMLVDYWVRLLQLGRMNFVTTIVDPVTNIDYILDSKDIFKLFVILLHRQYNIELVDFPDYHAQRVLLDPLPDLEALASRSYRDNFALRQLYKDVYDKAPRYTQCDTPYAFNQYITRQYLYNLGTWILECNTGDLDQNAQLTMFIERMHTTAVYSPGDETVQAFLSRISFTGVLLYSESVVLDLINRILNAISYNKLDFLGRNKAIQEALGEIFRQFTSYSTQLISTYFSSENTLANLKSFHITLAEFDTDTTTHVDLREDCIELAVNTRVEVAVPLVSRVSDSFDYQSITAIPLTFDLPSTNNVDLSATVIPPTFNVYPEEVWQLDLLDQDHLLFLAMNP